MNNKEAVFLITNNRSKAIRTLLNTDEKYKRFDELVTENLKSFFKAPHTTKEIQSCERMALLEIVATR
jgi:hypothetical protein